MFLQLFGIIPLRSLIPFSFVFFRVCVCVCVSCSQLGPNIKELFRLVEDFVDVIGLRMKDFQDMYEATDNLGQSYLQPGDLHSRFLLIKKKSKRKRDTVIFL